MIRHKTAGVSVIRSRPNRRKKLLMKRILRTDAGVKFKWDRGEREVWWLNSKIGLAESGRSPFLSFLLDVRGSLRSFPWLLKLSQLIKGVGDDFLNGVTIQVLHRDAAFFVSHGRVIKHNLELC